MGIFKKKTKLTRKQKEAKAITQASKKHHGFFSWFHRDKGEMLFVTRYSQKPPNALNKGVTKTQDFVRLFRDPDKPSNDGGTFIGQPPNS